MTRQEMYLARFWGRINKIEGGCWLWTGPPDKDGYGRHRHTRTHRFSWALHHGPIPAGLFVLHTCDIPACVNPDHLFLGTSQDNIEDMLRKKRNAVGAQTKRAVLTAEAIPKIRVALHSGQSQRSLARLYNVNPSTIADIQHGVTWKHIADPIPEPKG